MGTAEKETFVDRLLAEGEANAVLRVLAARGIDVPAKERAQVLGCKDSRVLGAWTERSANANTLDDVFGFWFSPKRTGLDVDAGEGGRQVNQSGGDELKRSQLARYTKIVLSVASKRAAGALEEMMADGSRDIVPRLLAEGEATGLLRVIAARGIYLPDELRDAILFCPDRDLLGGWTDRAANARIFEELFGLRLSTVMGRLRARSSPTDG